MGQLAISTGPLKMIAILHDLRGHDDFFMVYFCGSFWTQTDCDAPALENHFPGLPLPVAQAPRGHRALGAP